MLIALLVFLVLRQVMPIASGLAGGASLNSFGTVSRSISWAAGKTGPALRFATPFTARALKGAAHLPGRAARAVAGRRGTGNQALASSWRDS
jgi:type IV secretion system protein VirB6